MLKFAIIDYDAGNLFSLYNAFKSCGKLPIITHEYGLLREADVLVLPGVGAFGECIHCLRKRKIDYILYEAVKSCKPILGICLGMQILMDSSEEFGNHAGLGLIPGKVKNFRDLSGFDQKEKVPLMGWNEIEIKKQDRILENLPGLDMYFVHSLCVQVENPADEVAKSSYGNIEFSAVVKHGLVYGCQFHPEKSSGNGLRVIANFINMCEEGFHE